MAEELDTWRERALAVGCASLVDAMMRTHGHRATLPALASPTPERALFGPVVTMQFLPTRDDLPAKDGAPVKDRGFGDVFAEAVHDAPPGTVLVISSGGYPDVSHAGGVKLSRAQRHQLAGVLADGQLRDFAELASMDFATWCRGEAVRWGGDSVMPAAANVTVEVAGVTIVPGDYVYVDSAGGVVIPAASLETVLTEAETIVRDDEGYQRKIESGDMT
ncbi:RraA family protein [Ornithinimicrobium cryptoxanthini]|uniref:Putative 4-hydroxy-4-methyl-2-oxoglutarate aldolase n=1 Tax=Ornithinimicrobium cryptoxanthini TaxID=2934161 RepID=A0ABY4YKS9_9MICO|nr:RraA family protein [Ornithinimicrobium cryptoxanthini]USQ77326.1 RraA family protein [Ornithinimicrobium cryptoxanthini]